MKPTMELRWFLVSDTDPEDAEKMEGPCAQNAVGHVLESYVLQQKWVHEDGSEEWKEIEIAY